MQSKRLEAICSLLDSKDALIDIGCDHAYVPIEMAKRGAKKILATDIHSSALQIAKTNIQKNGYQSIIDCKLSDGLKEVDTLEYDTLVIAGMGICTMKHILSEKEKLSSIKKIIIQSNNDLPDLRLFMKKHGYAIQKEIVVLEKKHYYTIIQYQKGKQKLKKREIELGFFQKELIDYYQYLKNKYEKLEKEIPKKNKKKRKHLKRKIKWLTKWLNKL